MMTASGGHKRRLNLQPYPIVGDICSAVQLSDKIWSWGRAVLNTAPRDRGGGCITWKRKEQRRGGGRGGAYSWYRMSSYLTVDLAFLPWRGDGAI